MDQSIDFKHLTLKSAIARFMEKVHHEPNSGCWLWTAGYYGNGYPAFWFRGQNVAGHRFSYEALVASIPDELLVLHSCDTPECVNPEHLSVGTQQQNCLQMVQRGRCPNTKAKLTRDQVRSARCEYAAGATKAQLSRKYEVRDTTMGLLIDRRTWRDVE